MNKVAALFLVSAAVVTGLGFLAISLRPDAAQTCADRNTVQIYCAASVVKPVEQIVAAYNEKHQANIRIVRTGGSGELAGLIKAEFETGITDGADLFVTADALLLTNAIAAGVVATEYQIALQRPVIAVSTKCLHTINGVKDLVGLDLKFGVASERAAIGILAREIADHENVLSELETRKATDTENVMTLAQALVAGSLDAAIIWDTTVQQVNEANGSEVIRIAAIADASDKLNSNISAGVTTSSDIPDLCSHFAQYLSGSEVAQVAFEESGFTFEASNQPEVKAKRP